MLNNFFISLIAYEIIRYIYLNKIENNIYKKFIINLTRFKV